MLKKLTLRNFKQFREEMVVEFTPISILVGANNSGKSTVLQALSFFQYCMDVTRRKKNGGITLEAQTVGPEEFRALPVSTPSDLWPDGKTTGKTAGPISLKVEFEGGESIGFEIKLSFNRFSITPTTSSNISPILEQTKIRYVPIHSGLLLREEYLLAPARADRLRDLQYGAVLRNLLWDLKENDKERWKLLLGILERLYPESKLDVVFDREVDRFISSAYSDNNLFKTLDIVVSGTGFQQVLQILTGVLSQGSTIVLMDEPDAHLHAGKQVELMRVFEELSVAHQIQFILATHSPHLLASSSPGSLRALIDGKAHSFATTPEQMDILDTLGAFDRMEIIPLLRTKAIVFVENRDDRDYLKMFAKKLWGEVKTQNIWEGLCFLYTYQEPMAADAKRLARQIRDLLSSNRLGSLAGGRQPRFLVIGDRDYRSLPMVKKQARELEKQARSDDFKLDLKCYVWTRNEIENYLLDFEAIKQAALSSQPLGQQKIRVETVIDEVMQQELKALKEDARIRMASQLQQSDPKYRGDYSKTTREAQALIEAEWGDGLGLCDAKKLLSALRTALQTKQVRARLSESAIIKQMVSVPKDVKTTLNLLKKHAEPGRYLSKKRPANRKGKRK